MKKIALFLFALAATTTAGAKSVGETLELPDFSSGETVWIVRAGVGFNGVTGSNIDTQKAIWENGSWDGSFKSTAGYDFSVAFNKSFGESPMYWGMELALGMRGYKTDAEWKRSASSSVSGGSDYHKKTEEGTLSAYNARFTPFMFGYKYTFLERMAADVHLGVFAGYDFAGNYKNYTTDHVVSTSKYGNRNDFKENTDKVSIGDIEGMRKYDAGLNLGIGYWFGNFNIDFTWQRGFVPIYEDGSDEISIGGKKGQKREAGNLYSNNFQLRLGYAF